MAEVSPSPSAIEQKRSEQAQHSRSLDPTLLCHKVGGGYDFRRGSLRTHNKRPEACIAEVVQKPTAREGQCSTSCSRHARSILCGIARPFDPPNN